MKHDDFQSGAHVSLEQNLLQVAEQALAEYLGPIARILVSRAATNARTPDELFGLLAREVPNAEQRERFLNTAKRKFLTSRQGMSALRNSA